MSSSCRQQCAVSYQTLILARCFSDVDTIQTDSHGAQFSEDEDRHGELGLFAGEAEGVTPWLVLEFRASRGHHWWRSAATSLSCAALLEFGGEFGKGIRAVYRADNHAAYRRLWHRFDRHDGVAVATVSGRADPARLVPRDTGAGFYETSRHSKEFGWIYPPVWGDGEGETSAIFRAQDLAITQHVCAWAAAIPDNAIWLCSRW